MSGKVVDKDNGWREMMARARELANGPRVRVGILDDEPKKVAPGDEPTPLSLVEIAGIHEFGAPDAGIPQRSFIRATVDQRADDIARLLQVQAQKAIEGKITAEQALEQTGAKVVSWVQRTITSQIPPPLAPATLAKKTVNGRVGNVPLVNTGQLKSSITYVVVEGVEA